ncbi:MAG: redoxin domain-containing protein [Candidatus Thermoplasmatota archaeon]|nr:redoxin domain-containing protein [Candidatus Thermoplasmatota archaeon]
MEQEKKDVDVIDTGARAPDFELEDHKGDIFSLSGQAGRYVLLSFHPLAWTKVCAKQMQSLEAHVDDFEELDAIAVGISVDAVPSKKAWAESLDIMETRLLSDFWPHGQVAKKYGLFLPDRGISGRVNVIVDPEQHVAWTKVYDIPELPDIDEVLQALRGIR